MPSGSTSCSVGLPSSSSTPGMLDAHLGEVVGPEAQRVAVGYRERKVVERHVGGALGANRRHDSRSRSPCATAGDGARRRNRRRPRSWSRRRARSCTTRGWRRRRARATGGARSRGAGCPCTEYSTVLERPIMSGADEQHADLRVRHQRQRPRPVDRVLHARRSACRRRASTTSATCTRCWSATEGDAVSILLIKHTDAVGGARHRHRVREDRARVRRRRRCLRAARSPRAVRRNWSPARSRRWASPSRWCAIPTAT